MEKEPRSRSRVHPSPDEDSDAGRNSRRKPPSRKRRDRSPSSAAAAASPPPSEDEPQRRRRRRHSDVGDEDRPRRRHDSPPRDHHAPRRRHHHHRDRNDRSPRHQESRRDQDRHRPGRSHEEEEPSPPHSSRRPAGKDKPRNRPRSRSRSRSHPRSPSHSPLHHRPLKSHHALPSQETSFRTNDPHRPGTRPEPSNHPATTTTTTEKQAPNYRPTGLLAKEANTIAGTTTVLKYHEPPEARKPPARDAWRLYEFVGPDLRATIPLHTRSAWLCGRDAAVADLCVAHPSVSRQHAVVQFRFRDDGRAGGGGRVRLYLMDLESVKGSWLNGERVEARRFVELLDGDVLRFGEWEGEFVVMLPPVEGGKKKGGGEGLGEG